MTRTAKVGTAFAIFAAAVSFLISLAGSSLKSTVQVFFLNIADGFDVSRGSLAIATTLFAVVTAITSSVIGHLADRIGAIPVLAIGTALNGIVLLVSATAGELWMFVLTYGVVGAVAVTMLSFVPLGVLADQLFQGRNSGLFYALLTNGAAVGFIVLVPLWTYLDDRMSWNRVLFAIGVVFLVVLLPLSLALVRLSVRRRPAAAAAAPRVSFWSATAITFRHPQMRALVLAFVGCGTTMAFIDVHLFPHLHDHGISDSVGASAVAVLGALEIAGSLAAGRLCDLGWTRATLMAAYALRATAMVMLLFVDLPATVIAFGAVFGASYLATVVATTVWVTRALPPGVRGTALGVLWAVHMLAVAVTSQGGAILADLHHNYTATIVASVVLTAVSVLLVARQPSPDAAAGDDTAPQEDIRPPVEV
ncbi:MFS transporter [Micromonospora sp. WMMD1076]|uniref:MFS transporter n=1 Tax=Micromonospora sp. WMMD1076 TaxID=3016103 RepID=UPI00249A5E56|nr:MFS transporter [Micromonospora sp. WMMD1076]WFF09152.1 MFS transporter [Micromonospora sp. WMMD1076]